MENKRQPRPKVLVVEDNPINQELVAALLEKEGCETLTAETGEEAVRLALAEQPRLILMDIQLPGQTGYDTTRQLRARRATAAIPVVAVTAEAMKGDREKALAAGCDDYCTKPLDARRFLDIIRKFLSASAGNRPAREEGAVS